MKIVIQTCQTSLKTWRSLAKPARCYEEVKFTI